MLTARVMRLGYYLQLRSCDWDNAYSYGHVTWIMLTAGHVTGIMLTARVMRLGCLLLGSCD